MKVIYISPIRSVNPHLFPRFGFTQTSNPVDTTHCFLEAQSGVFAYDDVLKDVIKNRTPIICFDNREFGTMRHEKWHPINLSVDAYFIRNMSKIDSYPKNCYPFDWPYFPECDFTPSTKEELFSRPYDICFTGTESPTRTKFVNKLIKDGRLKIFYQFRDYTKRVPYDKWLDEHRQAKFYISCDGGGYSEERPQQLFSIAIMLRNKGDYIPANQFTDGVNFIEMNEEPTEGDINRLLEIVNDKEYLYYLYTNSISHTKRFLSGEAVTNYVLDKISKL